MWRLALNKLGEHSDGSGSIFALDEEAIEEVEERLDPVDIYRPCQRK